MVGRTVDITMDCTGSENMQYSSKNGKVTRRVDAGHVKFMINALAVPNLGRFVRTAKCSVTEIAKK
jgi:hypothetical protein